MLAVDTNVLVRLLVSDDLPQQQAALARLKAARARGEEVLVTSVVLAELSWVLDAAYGYQRAAIASAIERLLSTDPFACRDRTEVRRALEWYGKGPADFADYLILALAVGQGSETLLSFDRKLRRHPLVEAP